MQRDNNNLRVHHFYIVDISNPNDPRYVDHSFEYKLDAEKEVKTYHGYDGNLLVMNGVEITFKKIQPEDVELMPNIETPEEDLRGLDLNRMKISYKTIGDSKLARKKYWRRVKRRARKTLKNL